jgi:hypothetical protein
MMVRWNRSDEGFATSKCGRYKIEPLYWGCVRPQSYQLVRVVTWDGRITSERIGSFFATQRDAKEAANQDLQETEASFEDLRRHG